MRRHRSVATAVKGSPIRVIPQLPGELLVERATVDQDARALPRVDDRAALDSPADRLLGHAQVVGGVGDGEPAALVVATGEHLLDALGNEDGEQLERVWSKDPPEPLPRTYSAPSGISAAGSACSLSISIAAPVRVSSRLGTPEISTQRAGQSIAGSACSSDLSSVLISPHCSAVGWTGSAADSAGPGSSVGISSAVVPS